MPLLAIQHLFKLFPLKTSEYGIANPLLHHVKKQHQVVMILPTLNNMINVCITHGKNKFKQ